MTSVMPVQRVKVRRLRAVCACVAGGGVSSPLQERLSQACRRASPRQRAGIFPPGADLGIQLAARAAQQQKIEPCPEAYMFEQLVRPAT
jgi:hypothetical protein